MFFLQNSLILMIEIMPAGLNVLNKDVYYNYSVIVHIKSSIPIKCIYLN